MMPPAIRHVLWGHNYGRRWLARNGKSMQVIRALYPQESKTVEELRRSLGLDGKDAYCLPNKLWMLKKGDYLSGTRAGRYSLTDFGIWTVITHDLDLSFLKLCVLACACCAQARFAKTGMTGYYMRSYFERILGEYYSKKYLPKVFYFLNRKGFTTRYRKGRIMVYPDVLERLMARYGEYFERLESWLYDLKGSEEKILGEAVEGFSVEEDSLDSGSLSP